MVGYKYSVQPTRVSILSISFQFQFATFLDLCLLLVGIVASVVSGVALPVLIILFGDLIEQMLVPLQEPQMLSGDSSNSTEFVVSGGRLRRKKLTNHEVDNFYINPSDSRTGSKLGK